jgi:hypothetical protein
VKREKFDQITRHRKTPAHRPPWADIQLTKSERKGKTQAEIENLRKDKYIEANRERLEANLKAKAAKMAQNGSVNT